MGVMAPAAVALLAASCAPNVAPETMLAVVSAESGYDATAIYDDTAGRRVTVEGDEQAAKIARQLIDAGHELDLGLGQVNSRNLAGLDLSVDGAFDPCQNLAAAGKILAAGYGNATRAVGAGQQAIQMALSAYNTGNLHSGFSNGYVGRVLAARSKQAVGTVTVPALAPGAAPGGEQSAAQAPVPQHKASWDVFGELSPPDSTPELVPHSTAPNVFGPGAEAGSSDGEPSGTRENNNLGAAAALRVAELPGDRAATGGAER